MDLFDRLFGSKGLPRAGCTITGEGVKLGSGRRTVPLDDVDRFEVRRVDPEVDADPGLHLEVFWPGRGRRGDEPHEHLVLLTRSAKTYRIETSRSDSLGNVALQLNNQLKGIRSPGAP